jgi:hypothetical protein
LKITSFLIALLVTLLLLISCSEKADENVTAPQDDQTTDSQQEVTETEEEKILPDLPIHDYGGYEFTMLGREDSHWGSIDLYAELLTGDTINDAIFMRNVNIEEKYNIKISTVFSNSPGPLAKKNITAGDDVFDLISIDIRATATNLAEPGYVIDFNTIPYIDLDKFWWDQNARKQLSIGGKLFMTTNDLTIVDKEGAFIILFDKDLIEDYGLDIPYELVKINRWTVDIFNEMAKTVVMDLNGDNVINEEDRFGVFSEANVLYEAVLSSDELVFKKDGSDIPYTDLQNPRLLSSIEKWTEIMIDTNTTMLSGDYGSKFPGQSIWDRHLSMIAAKMVLFSHTSLSRVTMMRSYDGNFGILPMPKLDESQVSYANAVHPTCGTTLSVPVTAQDLERTGIILEALTAESHYLLQPSYYEVALKTKLSRDNESSDMLDIIFETRIYDLGRVYNWGDVSSTISVLAEKKTNDYISQSEKKASKIQSAMETTIEFFVNQ